ncbi:hypothetical protein pb186bvf_016264 [Paramecium bursaria]
MIGKEQQEIINQYSDTIIHYIDNQQKLTQMKSDVIIKLNEVTQVHFLKNQEKAQRIKEEFEQTKLIQKKLDEYIERINSITNTIDGMESSVDHIEIILRRLEQKLSEVEKIKQ